VVHTDKNRDELNGQFKWFVGGFPIEGSENGEVKEEVGVIKNNISF